MIKKILFICCLIHSAVIICGQTKIPTNSTEKNIVKLKKDDMIYSYSDGYQDQFGGQNGKKYMAAKFKKLLFKISKEDEKRQNKLLEIELANWMKNEEQIDDICIMGVRV